MLSDADVKTLFASQRRKLLNGAFRFTRDFSAAEDVVSLVFQKLWVNRGAVASPQHAPTWLYAVMLNACRDRHRHSRQERTRRQDWPHGYDPLDPAPSPDVAMVAAEELARRPHPDILRRLYLEGQTLKEIAGATGLTLGAVKSRSHQARHRHPA